MLHFMLFPISYWVGLLYCQNNLSVNVMLFLKKDGHVVDKRLVYCSKDAIWLIRKILNYEFKLLKITYYQLLDLLYI